MILTISKDNHIAVLDSLAEAERQPETEHFSSANELTKLASNWPTARPVEIWNNLPSVTRRQQRAPLLWHELQCLGE